MCLTPGRADHVTPTNSRAFVYGVERRRVRQDRLDAQGAVTSSIWYVGELIEYDDQTQQTKAFIFAGGQRVAFLRHYGLTATTKDEVYLHQDHLGSTDTITTAAGAVAERLSYDPHGLRRDADWQDATGTITPAFTTRGFTGHEHLDSLKLVHMNGRVYDPVLGRFLSPDPAYQNLAGTQTLNRYAYVLNNPLSYTDPSGYFFKKLFRAVKRVFSKAAKVVKRAVNSVKKVLAKNEVVRAAVAIAVAYFVGPAVLSAIGPTSVVTTTFAAGAEVGFAVTGTAVTYSTAAHIASAAVSGFVSGLVASGGDLKAAALSAVTAAAFSGVGAAFGHGSGPFASAQHAQKIAAHAVVGGVSSELQGGKFAHGALAGGFAQFAAPAINGIPSGAGQVAASAVAGGIGAELGGGKFANGAITGAFGRLFNDGLSSNSHEYDYRRQICSINVSGCTESNVFSALKGNAYPGQPAGSIVENGRDYSVFYMRSWGSIQVLVDESAMTITNISNETHIFCCGTVERSVLKDSGSIYVRTLGRGNNSGIFNATFNYVAGYLGFLGVDDRIEASIRKQQFGID